MKANTFLKCGLLACVLALSACKTVQTTQPGTVGVDRKQMMMLSANEEIGRAHV